MKPASFIQISLCLWALYTICSCQSSPELKLWYRTPASTWEETLPLGNGRIGMMPDGGIDQETVVLNDITMWSGSYDDTRQPEALKYLPQIRQLLLEGKNDQAQQLMYAHFTCGGQGSAHGRGAEAPYGSFQILGNLHLRYFFPNSRTDTHSAYQRALSLNRALAWTTFQKEGVTYRREYFVSQTEDVMIIKLTADQKGKLNFDANLDRPENYTCYSNDGVIHMEGKLSDGRGGKGTEYQVLMKILNEDGQQIADSACIHIKNATTAYIFISAGTSLWQSDYQQQIQTLLDQAIQQDYDYLQERHYSAWQYKFDRVELNLGEANDTLPTDQRLVRFQSESDPDFAALYFQYGRYLLISGTRENSLPLNLQGMWTNTVQTPWNGDYHLNINLQMNYWPVEVTHLPELHLPLINLVKNLTISGEVSAHSFYGAQGWVAHMMTNPWRFTAPGEEASWGATHTGGAWLCEHLWEHYAFHPDPQYLEEIYPILRGAALFFLSSMIQEPTHGWLVTAPSSSPENAFYMPNSHKAVHVCMGPTMDNQLVKELFTNTIQAARLLNRDLSLVDSLEKALTRLPPMQISSQGGYLQEWLEDYEEVEPQHRHISHLFGLYPSNQISWSQTPELAQAAQQTLLRRGDGGTGWSMAWKINFWARLQDGNKALTLLRNLLKPVITDGHIAYNQGGTYPNLLCAHPPFQIDGNLGGCAGIAEMLIQSQAGYIEILPALPDEWKSGHFKGLCVRGGGTVDACWEKGRLQKIVLTAKVKADFKLKLPKHIEWVKVNNQIQNLQGEMLSLSLQQGEKCQIKIGYKVRKN